MTYEEFVSDVQTVVMYKPKYIRQGQALMNHLRKVWPEEYKRLSSVHYYDETNIDCFYKDELIPNTLKHLEKVWKNYPE